MSFWSAITDRILGSETRAIIDVSPSMLTAIQTRGAYDPDRVPPYLSSRSANWADINPARIVDTARKSVIVYACLTYLADAVAESPLRVYRSTGDDKIEVPEHRARQVIANPNPYMSEAEFMALLVMAMGMQGYAIVEMVRSGGGLPVELWPLRPDWLSKQMQTNGNGASDYRYYAPGADPRTIPGSDLILIPYRHDDRLDSPGVSPLQIAAREVGIDSTLTEFLKVYLDSGGVPPFVIEYADALDQTVIDQIQEAWSQKYGGSRAYGKMPILHGGYKIAQIGDSLNAMAWPDLRAITEDKICQAFRVPRELVQTHSTAAGGSGLTTTEQQGAMLSLQRYGATPLRNRIDGAFTRSFLVEFTGGDPSYELQFDISDVLALQEDADARHTRIRADFDSGLLMLDEARQELGMQPLPGGAGGVFKVSFTTVFSKPTELAGSPSEPAPKQLPATTLSAFQSSSHQNGMQTAVIGTSNPACRFQSSSHHHNGMQGADDTASHSRRYRDESKLSPEAIEVRKNMIAANRRDQKRLSEVLNRKLVPFFKSQGKRVVAELEKSAGPIEVRSVANLQQMDWESELKLLTDIMSKFYLISGEAAASAANSVLGTSISWSISNPNIARVHRQLSQRIVGISDQTREDVANIVVDSLQEGVTLDELSGRLTGLFEETYRGRSMTIGRTESQVAFNVSSITSYRESGVVEEVEYADNPDHTEDYGASDGLSCADRNGLISPLAEAQSHIDGEHINGILAVIPLLATPLGE